MRIVIKCIFGIVEKRKEVGFFKLMYVKYWNGIFLELCNKGIISFFRLVIKNIF